MGIWGLAWVHPSPQGTARGPHADDSTAPDTGEGYSPITDMGAFEVAGSD
ncbi:MAG: hypothetical protein ABGY32_03915 [bacterium]